MCYPKTVAEASKMSSGNYSLYEREEPNLDGFDQEVYEAVSKEKPWELVEEFSTLRRISPSEDERRAAAYLEDRFQEYGISYERYDPEFWLSIPERASVQTTGPTREAFEGSEKRWREERPEVKALAFSGSGTVTGEVIRIDLPGTESSKDALEATSLPSDVDLEGKIVLIEEMVAAKQFFQEVEERGAKALVSIHPHPDEPQITTATPIWGAIPTPEQRDLVPEMINVTVSRSVGDRLLELLDQQETLELEVSAELSTEWAECPLVVAKISGEASSENDDFVLLHGHLDSWYYGVTDNATGNAGMVEIARVFNERRDQLKRDLWIPFWPAHEGGRYGGSTWFVDEFAHDLYDRCVAHVNFDSPGVEDAYEYNMTFWMPEANDLCRGTIDDVTGKESREARPPRAADYAFYNLGISGLMALSSGIPEDLREERGFYPVGGSGGNSEAWHHTTDTLDKADPNVLHRDIRVHAVIIGRLLSADTVPLDYRRTIERHMEIINEYDDIGGDAFDLSPVRDELKELEKAVEKLYEGIKTGDIESSAANEAMKSLSRHLVPVNFASEGRFEQDLAISRPPYPSLEPITELPTLEGDARRFRVIALRRARNEVVYQLHEARRKLPT